MCPELTNAFVVWGGCIVGAAIVLAGMAVYGYFFTE